MKLSIKQLKDLIKEVLLTEDKSWHGGYEEPRQQAQQKTLKMPESSTETVEQIILNNIQVIATQNPEKIHEIAAKIVKSLRVSGWCT